MLGTFNSRLINGGDVIICILVGKTPQITERTPMSDIENELQIMSAKTPEQRGKKSFLL